MAEVIRNDPIIIARYTRDNLEHIKAEFDRRGERYQVHVVTQLFNSLLGMVVLLHERCPKVFENSPPVKELGWAQWTICKGTCGTLGDLVRYVRNAAAHGRFSFSSDSRYMEDVTITVEDAPKCKPINWRAEIRGDQLYEFCMELTAYVKSKSPSS